MSVRIDITPRADDAGTGVQFVTGVASLGGTIGVRVVIDETVAASRSVVDDLFRMASEAILRQPWPVSGSTTAVPAIGWNTGQTFLRTGAGVYSTSFDETAIDALKPAATTTYYVDPINGVDAAAGTSRGTALKSLSVAIAKPDVDQVIIINMVADLVARSTAGWGSSAPTARSFAVINETPQFRYISAGASGTLNSWSADTTYPAVQKATRGAAPAQLVDTSLKSKPFFLASGGSGYMVGDRLTLPNGAILSVTATEANGAITNWAFACRAWKLVSFASMQQIGTTGMGAGATFTNIDNRPLVYFVAHKVASLAAVSTSFGSTYDDGTNTFYLPPDGRTLAASSPAVVLTVSGVDSRTPTGSNLTTYISGVDFIGSNSALLTSYASSNTGSRVACKDVSFQASSLSNGRTIAAFIEDYAYRCGYYNNFADGDNQHSFESDNGATTGTSPKSLRVECARIGNGTTGSTGVSDNDITAHDECILIDVNGDSCGSDDRVATFIDNSRVWLFGGRIGAAKQGVSGKETLAVYGTAQVWIDGTEAAASASGRVLVDNTAILRHRNVSFIPDRGKGSGTVGVY